MHWDDMTDEQRSNAELFAQKLTSAGWEASEILDMLRDGMVVDPEGIGYLDAGPVKLDVKYSASGSFLVLWLDCHDPRQENRWQLEFSGRENLAAILDWLVEHQEALRPATFCKHLSAVINRCTRVFLVREGGSLFPIERNGG